MGFRIARAIEANGVDYLSNPEVGLFFFDARGSSRGLADDQSCGVCRVLLSPATLP